MLGILNVAYTSAYIREALCLILSPEFGYLIKGRLFYSLQMKGDLLLSKPRMAPSKPLPTLYLY
jgi:hypothetical protein